MTSDQDIRLDERQVAVERYGSETHRVTLGRDAAEVALQVFHVERRATSRLDRLGRAQAIELPSQRRGEWIYRSTTYAVDPFDVLAYVGDATGAEAVRLSEEFLARCDETFDPPFVPTYSPDNIQETNP